MVDAIKVPCSNAISGCDKYITCYQKEKHEKTCMHAPCFCPEDGCPFEGSTRSLLNHFVTQHKWSVTKFDYDKAHRISIPRHRRFVPLVGEDQSVFLMVNTFAHVGNALSTLCIRPHESGSCYSSKISAIHRAEADKGGRYVFQMDPHVASSSLHGGVQLGRFFLLVPPDLVDESTEQLTVNIRIEKIKCAVHHWSYDILARNGDLKTFGHASTGLEFDFVVICWILLVEFRGLKMHCELLWLW